MSFRSVFLLLVLAWPGFLKAQEIKHIDISNVRSRTELRHPPAPQSDCKEGTHCIGGGSGGGSVADGAPDQRDPHALGIYLLRVTPTDINATEPFQVEFKVLNTGTAPMELPVSPHLSDLQPSDESVAFNYFSLALVVRGQGEPQGLRVDSVGFVELFGSPDHTESMMILRPGEWIRVSASVKLLTWSSEPVSARFRGDFWLRKNTFHPHPGGQFIEALNLYPNDTPTPFMAVRLFPPAGSKLPKQPQSDNTVVGMGHVLARIEGLARRINSLSGQRYEVFIFGIDKWERYGKSAAPVKVVYEFYRDEPNLPEKFFDFSSRYELTVVRDTKCDESVKSLSYEANVSESGKPLPATYVLKVLDGAPTDVLKPDLILPCFVLRPGQYRVVSKGKNLYFRDAVPGLVNSGKRGSR